MKFSILFCVALMLLTCGTFANAQRRPGFRGPPGGDSPGGNNCPQICPAIFAPVCASNGRCTRQFSNSCELGGANCNAQRKFTEVPCLGNERSTC